jgi:Zn-dependent protease
MPGRPHLRIGSIPIHVEWPFFLIAALLGGNLIQAWPGNRLLFLLIWIAIVFVSILVHELGHAVAYRMNAQHPQITITAFWGLTHGQRELPKWRSVMVSLSGVIAAIVVLAIPAKLLYEGNVLFPAYSKWNFVVYEVWYINLWWSVANLLPLLPLDGGQITRTLWGLRTARFASLASGAVVTIWLFVAGHTFAAIFIAMLALMNLAEAMQEGYIGSGRGLMTGGGRDYGSYEPPAPRRSEKPKKKRRAKRGRPDLHVVPPPPPRPVARPVDPDRLEAATWDALRLGDAVEAESLLLEATGRGGVSPHLSASIAAAQGRGDEAVRLFAQAFTVASTPPNLVVARVIADAQIAVPLAEQLLSGSDEGVDATAQLQNHLHFTGAYREAAVVGERLVADGRRSPAQSSYEVACSWAKAGDAQAGLSWLRRAIEAGFRAPRLIENEDDLATVRALPGYRELAQSLKGD